MRGSHGWKPLKSCALERKNVQLYYNSHYFKVWDSFGLSQYRFRAGNFLEEVEVAGTSMLWSRLRLRFQPVRMPLVSISGSRVLAIRSDGA